MTATVQRLYSLERTLVDGSVVEVGAIMLSATQVNQHADDVSLLGPDGTPVAIFICEARTRLRLVEPEPAEGGGG
jgi:hypothetical protein